MPFALIALVIACSAPRSARAVVLVRVHGTDFVDYHGERYASADVHLTIDYDGGEYWLSGFGLHREPVRPYFSPHFKSRRSLVFRGVRADSKLRPVVTVRPDGRAFLVTTRLAAAKLALTGPHWVEPQFYRHTFVTNAVRLRVTFDNVVARRWRQCARWLSARTSVGARSGSRESR